MENEKITGQDFEKVDIRVGTIKTAEIFNEAKLPAYKLTIDFGDLGIKKSSAQITERYHTNDLIGRQVIAVVNFPPKQIANIMSECLVLGGMSEEGVVLLTTDFSLPNGAKVG
jgi:tRNA-binding protein